MRSAHACWVGLLLSTLTCAVCAAEPCAYNAERNAELEMAGISRIVIDAGAGLLQVTGERARPMLTVKGNACAAQKAALDEIELRTRREGETAYVTAVLPDHLWNAFDWIAGELALDLVIAVPDNVALEIDDSSGSVELRNVGPTKVDDSSGSLQVSGVNGDLSVDDGSGTVTLREIRGNLTLADGSGSVSVASVTGNVRVRDDGSGSMTLRDVTGDVVIVRDGSGNIEIAHVGGGVTIGDDGSGSIDIRDVKQDVTVRDDGSGSIFVADVGGSLNVGDGGSGGIRYERVAGSIRAASD